MITKKEVFEQTDKLYAHLMEAYDIAGGLRDSFSGVEGELEGLLKEHCNEIRGKIYDLRSQRGRFKERILQLPNPETQS